MQDGADRTLSAQRPSANLDRRYAPSCPFPQALRTFNDRYPDYRATSYIDELRASDYSRLHTAHETYLDYTGGSLYGASQLRQHIELLTKATFGNPHSGSRTSAAATEHVESVRHEILTYFKCDPKEYVAIFTLNASGALKLIGEAFPFTSSGRLLLATDNHNSVNGIREFAAAAGSSVEYAPLTTPDLRLDRKRLSELLDESRPESLFAFPAQSNFSGVKHPLEFVEQAQRKGWRVLLDAAAYVPTNELDLSRVQPDFVTVSFYKMFGYPTGVGALIMRRWALAALKRPWFAGGTVRFASVQARAHVLASGPSRFEDGTVNYLAIPAVGIGLRHVKAVGVQQIQNRTACLTSWLLEELLALRHTNGRPVVRIYGPTTMESRGATIAMNCYDPAGGLIDYHWIERTASEQGISIRSGCFCNPGAGEIADGLTATDIASAMSLGDDISLERFVQWMRDKGIGKSAGAIRVSLGIASNFRDAWNFLNFVGSLVDTPVFECDGRAKG